MIEVENLSKLYGEVRAVDGVSFRIGRGEIVGLLGPNGAGKTTLMRILAGYHLPDEGTASVDGHDVREGSLALRRAVGYLPENAPLYEELTAKEYLQFIAGARGLPRAGRQDRIREVADLCGIGSVIEQPISALSKGFKQRVGIAQAMIHAPQMLVLDEPTSGLDPNQVTEMRRLLTTLGGEKTVLLSTHILGEVEAVCGRVLIMDRGRIVATGTPEEIGTRLRGSPRYRCEIRAPRLSADDLLGVDVVAGVASFENVAEGVYVAELIAAGGPEVGERLFDWAVEHKYKIVSMAPLEMSLEEIFARLTQRAGNDEA